MEDDDETEVEEEEGDGDDGDAGGAEVWWPSFRRRCQYGAACKRYNEKHFASASNAVRLNLT